MTIQEEHQQIINRITSVSNYEKYYHLVNSPDKTVDEQKLHDNIIKLGEYVSMIDNYATGICTVPLDLLDSECCRLIRKILEQLNQQKWKYIN